jgi:hypothetical protein
MRDLKRRTGDVAKKHAERRYAHADRPPVFCRVRVALRAAPAADEHPVTCGLSCETGAQGLPEEQGHRSHADGLRGLVAEMGLGSVEAEVRLEQERRDPLRYWAREVTFVLDGNDPGV